MELEPVIGLEIHVQLKTDSKMFCSCANNGDTQPPNTTICPICLGHPGTLPYPNKKAIEYGIKAALALGCTINSPTKFDRKHYFYPDLPKGYQISQFDKPIGANGHLDIQTGNEVNTIRIERLHLEEDAAKNVHHKPNVSHIDYNRAGTPLAEIVTHPDITSAQQAKIFLQELRLIMRTIGVSDADMEKGHLRCDANVSMRHKNSDELHPKTEVKNLNSFKSVERAIEYEIQRQTKLWQTNTPPATTTTRGWHDTKQETYEQRSKEEANDYRYFPEPDIPSLDISSVIEAISSQLPELPADKRVRFSQEYALKPSDIIVLVDNPELADFTEQVMSELYSHLSEEIDDTQSQFIEKNKKKIGHLAGSWITSKLLGVLNEQNINLTESKLTPENFAELIALVSKSAVNSSTAVNVLKQMITSGEDPSNIVDAQGLQQVSDTSTLETIARNIIENNPDEVEKYKNGKTQLIQFFIGKMMKESKGSADPAVAHEIFSSLLSE